MGPAGGDYVPRGSRGHVDLVGWSASPNEPSPSWPEAPVPQAHTDPSEATARLWVVPAAMSVKVRPDGGMAGTGAWRTTSSMPSPS